jgi:hypothetical protein
MMQISSTFRAPPLLSPRTANYVAALIRQGDNFDYYEWLQRVRDEEAEAEAEAKQVRAAFTSGKLIAAEIGPPIGTDCREAWPNSGLALMTRTVPVPRAMWRPSQECTQDRKGSTYAAA